MFSAVKRLKTTTKCGTRVVWLVFKEANSRTEVFCR
jgi:hypothetical protein